MTASGADVEHIKRKVAEFFLKHPQARGNRNADALIKQMEKFECHNGLLYRKVIDVYKNEVRLCCYAPLGSLRAVQQPTGLKVMSFRNELILEYHNSLLA